MHHPLTLLWSLSLAGTPTPPQARLPPGPGPGPLWGEVASAGRPSPEATGQGLWDHGGRGAEGRGGRPSRGSQGGARVVLEKAGPGRAWLLRGRWTSEAPHADPPPPPPEPCPERRVSQGDPRALPLASPRRPICLHAVTCPGGRGGEGTVVMEGGQGGPEGKGTVNPEQRAISGKREAHAPEEDEAEHPDLGRHQGLQHGCGGPSSLLTESSPRSPRWDCIWRWAFRVITVQSVTRAQP